MFFEVIPLHKLYFDKSLSYLVLVLTYSTYCILYVKVIPLECWICSILSCYFILSHSAYWNFANVYWFMLMVNLWFWMSFFSSHLCTTRNRMSPMSVISAANSCLSGIGIKGNMEAWNRWPNRRDTCVCVTKRSPLALTQTINLKSVSLNPVSKLPESGEAAQGRHTHGTEGCSVRNTRTVWCHRKGSTRSQFVHLHLHPDLW